METPDMTVFLVQKKQSASRPREASGLLYIKPLLFHAGWVRLIARSLEKRRYELLERFRLLEEFWRG